MHRYRILLKSELDPIWEDWLGDMELTHKPDGSTVLVGFLKDQAALYGVLAKLRDLGLTLLSIERLDK